MTWQDVKCFFNFHTEETVHKSNSSQVFTGATIETRYDTIPPTVREDGHIIFHGETTVDERYRLGHMEIAICDNCGKRTREGMVYEEWQDEIPR